jgi:hypothetical protein
MGVNFNDFWILGSVRVRAKAPDPFAGLRGRAYITARKLGQMPLKKIESPADAEAKRESRENLVKAINQRPATAVGGQIFWLASGSVDWLPEKSDRRWFPLPELTMEEK